HLARVHPAIGLFARLSRAVSPFLVSFLRGAGTGPGLATSDAYPILWGTHHIAHSVPAGDVPVSPDHTGGAQRESAHPEPAPADAPAGRDNGRLGGLVPGDGRDGRRSLH